MTVYEKEKLLLISDIIKTYLVVNSNREETWYGEKFNKLYDMHNDELRHLLAIRTRSEKHVKYCL